MSTRETLKSYFETGDKPTQAEFGELIDSLALQEEVNELKENMGEYVSEIDNKDLEMPEDVGGLLKGTKVSDISGKSYNEVLDDLLFPTVFPTFSKPSSSIKFKDYDTIQEVGAQGPTRQNFIVEYNPGAITLNGIKQADRGGAPKLSDSFIYVNGDTDNKTLPSKITLGNTPFRYQAAYIEGPQPYDNKGNPYESPLPAGHVDSNTITVNGTYPWYATTKGSLNGIPSKQPLIQWNAVVGSMVTPEFTLLPTDTCAQVISTPREIKHLYIKDVNSGNFIESAFDDFNMVQENLDINGTQVTYYTYTYVGAARGEITLKIKF